jgi:hypothetical protein
MNSHYTGYELELNQSRQASLRAEFEHQAQVKLLNDPDPNLAEPFTPSPKHFWEKRHLVKIGFGLASLLSVALVLAYLVLLPAYPASAVQPKPKSELVSPANANTGLPNPVVTNPVEATPPPTMAVANPLPVGDYTVRIVARDIPNLLRFDEPSVNKYRGDWTVSLDDRGNFTIMQNDQVLMEGAFVVNQDQITFSSEEGTPLCGTDPEEISATYQWYPVGSFTTAYPVEEGIGLMPVSSDKCYARSLVLATHPLKLVNPIYNPVSAQPF